MMNDPSLSLALRGCNAIDKELDNNFYSAVMSGKPLDRLPQIAEDSTIERGERADKYLKLIDEIDLEAVPHDLAISVLVAKQEFLKTSTLGKHYWHVHDLAGAFPGMFSMTAYSGGFVLNAIHQACAIQPFEHSGDLDRYLGLVEDYGRLIRQMLDRTRGQAERGIRINKPQLAQARAMLSGMGQVAGSALLVDSDRIAGVSGSDSFAAEVEKRLNKSVLPAFDSLSGYLDSDYEAEAPDAVGLCSVPGGAEVYEALIPLHLTMQMSAQEVHDAGHERMARIKARMAELREIMGEGTAAEFHKKLKVDKQFIAESPDEVEANYNKYLRRIEPEMLNHFNELVEAPYAPRALPAELAESMTFGYYDAPRPGKPEGYYLFNANKLEEKSQAWAGALIYHELIPGHHFQLSKVKENKNLTGFRGKVMFTSYAEGWAEYAATLAGEMGMYKEPMDEYGRCISDSFLTSRLVVDTGMNAFGWSLQEARDYMTENTFFSEFEINSETLRYSSDIPGQALGYKLGDTKILDLRQKAMDALGNKFNLKDFHDVVLDVGSIPLTALEYHVDRYIAEERS